MGCCCSKEDDVDGSFQGPGRTLGGSAPAQVRVPASSTSRTAPVPAAAKPSQQLGTAVGESGDARSAAARAAEERVKASQPKGKLGRALDAQKSQTQAATMAQNARDNLAARNADEAAATRNWN